MDCLLQQCTTSIIIGDVVGLSKYLKLYPIIPIYNLLELSIYQPLVEPFLLLLYIFWKTDNYSQESLAINPDDIKNSDILHHIISVSDDFLLDQDFSESAEIYLSKLYDRENWVIKIWN